MQGPSKYITLNISWISLSSRWKGCFSCLSLRFLLDSPLLLGSWGSIRTPYVITLFKTHTPKLALSQLTKYFLLSFLHSSSVFVFSVFFFICITLPSHLFFYFLPLYHLCLQLNNRSCLLHKVNHFIFTQNELIFIVLRNMVL